MSDVVDRTDEVVLFSDKIDEEHDEMILLGNDINEQCMMEFYQNRAIIFFGLYANIVEVLLVSDGWICTDTRWNALACHCWVSCNHRANKGFAMYWLSPARAPLRSQGTRCILRMCFRPRNARGGCGPSFRVGWRSGNFHPA